MSVHRALAMAALAGAGACAPAPTLPVGGETLACAPALDHEPSFLEGCWLEQVDGRVTTERWRADGAGRWVGAASTVVDGVVVHDEGLAIDRSDGRWRYHASPRDQAPATFTATRVGPACAWFEAPTHDFPQRIAYQRDGDRLVARIDGDRSAVEQWSTWRFVRVPCVDDAQP